MKFAIFVGLACLSVVISGEKETEKVWGDVSPTEAAELGRIKVQAHKTDTKPATYTFTYPDPAASHPIIGLKLIDRHGSTELEFIKGRFGDKQLTIRLTADHNIDCECIFYYRPY